MSGYKPGHIYAVSSWRGEALPAFRTRRGDIESWCVLQDDDTRGLEDHEVTEARPLVVLDLPPHDLARVLDALRADRGYIALRVAEQIEAQTRPPKPAEPTGLGAVVRDREGRLWLRYVGGDERPRWCGTGPGHGGVRAYSAIDAVEVLSEGVPC